MESPHQEDGGDNFIGPLGILNFHLPLGGAGASQMVGLKFLHIFRGTKGEVC